MRRGLPLGGQLPAVAERCLPLLALPPWRWACVGGGRTIAEAITLTIGRGGVSFVIFHWGVGLLLERRAQQSGWLRGSWGLRQRRLPLHLSLPRRGSQRSGSSPSAHRSTAKRGTAPI